MAFGRHWKPPKSLRHVGEGSGLEALAPRHRVALERPGPDLESQEKCPLAPRRQHSTVLTFSIFAITFCSNV